MTVRPTCEYMGEESVAPQLEKSTKWVHSWTYTELK